MPKYPAQIDNSQSLPTAVDNLTPVQGSVFNRLRDAVLSIENELGIKPSGVYSNVAARVGNLETIVGNLRPIEIQEDIGGTPESPLIVGLQGRPVSDQGPAPNEVLFWNGVAWVPGGNVNPPPGPQGPPGPPGSVTSLSGDVTGPPATNTVVTITGAAGTVTITCPNIMYTGGVDVNSLPLPTTSALRATFRTTDATTGVLNTVTPSDGQIIRVLSEVAAVRKDVDGYGAWFLLKAVFLRQGGSLIVVSAPVVVSTGATAGATAWTAVLAANGTAIETQVTGEAGKTIHWSIIREYIEGS